MTAPQALIEFFQKEATEYLDRLDEVLAGPGVPDAAAFLASARALRGSATMTRLDGLPEFAATLERIAAGVREGELRWDQRLHLAVRGAVSELRVLVAQAPVWCEAEQRQARTRSVSLAALASGQLGAVAPADMQTEPVVPIARFFPEDGMPPILQRNPRPAVTLAQRFRHEIAVAADGVAREAAALITSNADAPQLDGAETVRRALFGLSVVSESYGAASIAALATTMARAPLGTASECSAVRGFALLLMDRELTESQLAQQVKQASRAWNGGTPVEPAIVSIDTLLYRGHSAVSRAREVRDQLTVHWQRGSLAQPEAQALFEELSDLLDLATTT